MKKFVITLILFSIPLFYYFDKLDSPICRYKVSHHRITHFDIKNNIKAKCREVSSFEHERLILQLEKLPILIKFIPIKNLEDQEILEKIISKNITILKDLPEEIILSDKNFELYLTKYKDEVNEVPESILLDENRFKRLEKKRKKYVNKKERISNKRLQLDIIAENEKKIKRITGSLSNFRYGLRRNPNLIKEIDKSFFTEEILKYLINEKLELIVLLNEEVLKSEPFIKVMFEKYKGEENFFPVACLKSPFFKKYEDQYKNEMNNKLNLFIKNKEVFLSRLKNGDVRKNLEVVPIELFQDKEFVSEMIKANPVVLQGLPIEASLDVTFVLKTLDKYFERRAMTLSEVVSENYEVQKWMIANRKVSYLNNTVKQDEEFLKLIVSTNPYYIFERRVPLSDELLLSALKNWRNSKEKTKSTRNLFVKTEPFLLGKFNSDFGGDLNESLVLEILNKDPFSILSLSVEQKKYLSTSLEKDLLKKAKAILQEELLSDEKVFFPKRVRLFEDDISVAKFTFKKPDSLKSFSKKVRSNNKLLKELFSKNPRTIYYSERNILKDKKFMNGLSGSQLYRMRGLHNEDTFSIKYAKKIVDYLVEERKMMQGGFGNSIPEGLKTSKFVDNIKFMNYAVKKHKDFIFYSGEKYISYLKRKRKLKKIADNNIDYFLFRVQTINSHWGASLIKYSKIPHVFNNNEKYLKAILRKAPYLYNGVSEKFRSSSSLVESTMKGWEDLDYNRVLSSIKQIVGMNYRTPAAIDHLSLVPLHGFDNKFRSDQKIVKRALKVTPLSMKLISYTLEDKKEFKIYKNQYERIINSERQILNLVR